MNWQTIETAPKDGTIFLSIGIDIGGHFLDPIICAWQENANCFGVGYTFDSDRHVSFQIETKPTHWMPLPEPPK